MTCINQLWILWCKSFQFCTLSVRTQQYTRLNIFFLLIALSLKQTQAMHIWKHFFSMVNMWEQQHSNVFIFISKFHLISKALTCKKNSGLNQVGDLTVVFIKNSAEEEWRTKTWRLNLLTPPTECRSPQCRALAWDSSSQGQFSHVIQDFTQTIILRKAVNVGAGGEGRNVRTGQKGTWQATISLLKLSLLITRGSKASLIHLVMFSLCTIINYTHFLCPLLSSDEMNWIRYRLGCQI